jgi:hypothetical protein
MSNQMFVPIIEQSTRSQQFSPAEDAAIQLKLQVLLN